MSEMFDIVLSRALTADELATALAEILPRNLQVDVAEDFSGLPDEPGAIWALVGGTDDPRWPCVFNCLVCSEEADLGPFPDLGVAEGLWHRFAVDSLCSIYPFAGDLDPYDPYWSLACIEGQWFLSSTCGTRLMGEDMDRANEIRLIRPVTLPAMQGS